MDKSVVAPMSAQRATRWGQRIPDDTNGLTCFRIVAGIACAARTLERMFCIAFRRYDQCMMSFDQYRRAFGQNADEYTSRELEQMYESAKLFTAFAIRTWWDKRLERGRDAHAKMDPPWNHLDNQSTSSRTRE